MERIINNKFLEFIKIIKNDFKNEKCFNAGGYLGSMLYFDFGNQISKKSILHKEKTIILGSKKIGIRDCYWEMIICDFTLINSDDIDVYSFNFSIFNLQSLIDIKFDNKIFKIFFSNNIEIHCDLSNKNDADLDDPILEFDVLDKYIFDIFAYGKFIIDMEYYK